MLTKTHVQKLLDYAEANPKLITITTLDTLVKLNYTRLVHHGDEMYVHIYWNDFTRISRGIIIDRETLEIIAYPFNKFYNEFEYENTANMVRDLPNFKPNIPYQIPWHLRYWILEKLDGVLVIPYYYNGDLRFSTRGSFNNPYIDKVYEIATFDSLPLDRYTFMFELVSPEFSRMGHLVTKYDEEALILIGIRDMKTHKLLLPPDVIALAKKYDLQHFKIFENTYQDIKQIQDMIIGSTIEGWVVFFENTFLMKMKRREYFNLFRAIKGINLKRVLNSLITGTYDNFIMALPEEVRPIVEKMYKTVRKARQARIKEVLRVFKRIPSEILKDRKRFFIWLNDKYSKEGDYFLKKYLAAYYLKRQEDALYELFYREMLKNREKFF
jgi:hypothetical protein